MLKVSKMLDKLLVSSGYDREMRPGLEAGRVTGVRVNMAVTTLGPIYDDKELLLLTCYLRYFLGLINSMQCSHLRQSWTDSRLRFSHFHDLNMTELSLNWIFLDNIWKPDTYILGGRESFLHRITSPNRLVRLADDGTISYSQRLTLATKCKMNLRKFPLDSQTCRVELSSFGYTMKEVRSEMLK